MAKDGISGLRAALRGLAREMRETLAQAAERFAGGDDIGDIEATERAVANTDTVVAA